MMGVSSDMTLSWSTSRISVMEPISAVNILYSEDIKNAELPVNFREEKLKQYMENDVLPENAAKNGFVNAVISPSETRVRIISALYMFSGKREIKSLKRHGNMPL